MRSRARTALAGFVLVTAGATACTQHGSVAAQPANHAACTQLGAAYTAVNSSSATPGASAVFRRAISVATRASNRQLGSAIVDWVTAMQRPTGKAVQGAPYAIAECRRIGIPVEVHAAGTSLDPGAQPGTTPAPGSPTSKPAAGDNSDSQDGND